MGVNRHPFVKDKWDERAYFLAPGSGGVNNLRRGVMVGVRKGAERAGFDPAMHAKKVVNHRQSGHGCREVVYEDTSTRWQRRMSWPSCAGACRSRLRASRTCRICVFPMWPSFSSMPTCQKNNCKKRPAAEAAYRQPGAQAAACGHRKTGGGRRGA